MPVVVAKIFPALATVKVGVLRVMSPAFPSAVVEAEISEASVRTKLLALISILPAFP
jgi:hypothetical protein